MRWEGNEGRCGEGATLMSGEKSAKEVEGGECDGQLE